MISTSILENNRYMLPSRTIEKTLKGVANHTRIDIVKTLESSPYLTLEEISQRLSVNYKTASAHVKTLTSTGLIRKQNHKTSVRHSLTQQGKSILKFLRMLE